MRVIGNEVWQNENKELLRFTYRSQKNYTIKILNKKSNVCFVAFSGNGLYYPNEKEVFYDIIYKKNYFEWENVILRSKKMRKYIGKVIFLRDIYKQWYVSGINKELDTIEKIKDMLEKETIGYDIYTIGNSAGGYLATLMGMLLNAKCVYSFSGQFDLTKEIEKQPLLRKYWKEINRSKYFDIVDYISNSDTPIFYFYPCYVEEDNEQAILVRDYKNVFMFPISEKNHGTTILGINYEFVFTMNRNRLMKISKTNKKYFNKYTFYFLTAGFFNAIVGIIKKMVYTKQ